MTFNVRFTADIFRGTTLDSEEDVADYDESGWIDPKWSVWDIQEEQTEPETFDTYAEALERAAEVIGAAESGDGPYPPTDYPGTRVDLYSIDQYYDRHSMLTGDQVRLMAHIDRAES